MDREILFRGFHKEPNGKDIAIINGTKEHGTWLYGNLLRTDDGWYIIQNYIPTHMLSKYEVTPSTVGQYTGLTDKNGKKIFEGDMVNAHFKANRSKQIFRVIFRDGAFQFDNGRVVVGFAGVYSLNVIGSVHDNPELIGGESDD